MIVLQIKKNPKTTDQV